MLKKKLIWVFIIALVLITGSALLIMNIMAVEPPISTSPDNQYQINYNRSGKAIKITNKNDPNTITEVLEKDPEFFWSSNSRFLAETYTKDGYKQSVVIDFNGKKGGITMPAPFEIQDACPESKTKIEQKQFYASVYFVQWLDNTHGLIKFSLPSDVEGEQISGWLTCEFPSRTISDVHITTN